jgi:amino acid transporter
MFSKGQLIFAIAFVIAFISITIYSYRKDKKNLPEYFKGSYKIVIGFFIAISFLVLVKYLTTR